MRRAARLVLDARRGARTGPRGRSGPRGIPRDGSSRGGAPRGRSPAAMSAEERALRVTLDSARVNDSDPRAQGARLGALLELRGQGEVQPDDRAQERRDGVHHVPGDGPLDLGGVAQGRLRRRCARRRGGSRTARPSRARTAAVSRSTRAASNAWRSSTRRTASGGSSRTTRGSRNPRDGCASSRRASNLWTWYVHSTTTPTGRGRSPARSAGSLAEAQPVAGEQKLDPRPAARGPRTRPSASRRSAADPAARSSSTSCYPGNPVQEETRGERPHRHDRAVARDLLADGRRRDGHPVHLPDARAGRLGGPFAWRPTRGSRSPTSPSPRSTSRRSRATTAFARFARRAAEAGRGRGAPLGRPRRRGARGEDEPFDSRREAPLRSGPQERPRGRPPLLPAS